MKNINDIMSLAAEMMQTDNKHKFFFEYYGHVQKIEIRYYENGWSAEPDNKPVTIQTVQNKLKNCTFGLNYY